MREDGFPRRRTNLKRARGPNQLASHPLSPALALAPVMPEVAAMPSPVTETEIKGDGRRNIVARSVVAGGRVIIRRGHRVIIRRGRRVCVGVGIIRRRRHHNRRRRELEAETHREIGIGGNAKPNEQHSEESNDQNELFHGAYLLPLIHSGVVSFYYIRRGNRGESYTLQA